MTALFETVPPLPPHEGTVYRDGELHREMIEDDGRRFVGHDPRSCGEHRTVGSHRAWCFDCREWCYPDAEMACEGCIEGGLTA